MYSTGGEHLPFPALAPGTPAPRPTTDSRALGMTAERERRGRAMKRARASVADRAPMRPTEGCMDRPDGSRILPWARHVGARSATEPPPPHS